MESRSPSGLWRNLYGQWYMDNKNGGAGQEKGTDAPASAAEKEAEYAAVSHFS